MNKLLLAAGATLLSLATFASAQDEAAANRVTNLYDAFGPKVEGVVKDWGYAAIVEYNGKRILFDAGNNADMFKQNIEALGIDLTDLDFAVLSHAHADHLVGFDYVFSVKPDLKLYVPLDRHTLAGPAKLNIGGPEEGADEGLDPDERYFDDGQRGASSYVVNPTGRWWGRDVEFVTEDQDLGDGLRLVVTQSPYVGSANAYPPNEANPRITPLNELSLTLHTDQGQVLIVGCSHSGVENIVKAVKDRYDEGVHTLVGGFHLYPYPASYILDLVRKLRDEQGVTQVSPSHCTGHLGLRAFKHVYGDDYHRAGLGTVMELPQ